MNTNIVLLSIHNPNQLSTFLRYIQNGNMKIIIRKSTLRNSLSLLQQVSNKIFIAFDMFLKLYMYVDIM